MSRKAALSFGAGVVARLIREASGPARDVADGGCAGLTLRVSPTAATWYARAKHEGRQVRILLGDAKQWTLLQARAVCVDVRRHLDAGQGAPAREWIELRRAAAEQGERRRRGKGGEDVVVPEFMPRDRPPETWTLVQARDAWEAHMRREVEANALRPATVRNYIGVMGCPAMRTLDARHVSRIAPEDVAGVIEALVADGKRSSARDVARVAKRFWAWMASPAQVRQSGAARKAMEDLEGPRLGDVTGRRHVPMLPEIAHMLSVAQDGVLSDGVGMSIELLVYTAQRRRSIVRARVDEFEAWPERDGWGLWWQGRRNVRRGAPTPEDPRAGAHVLPLPPHVWWRVQAYLRRTTADAAERGMDRSEWMFPAVRPRRVGDPVGHLAEDTLTHAVAAMPGRRASPHDVRRAFARILQRDHGVSAVHVGMVLDHAGSSLVRHVDPAPMARHSTDEQMLALKAPVLAAWAEALVVARRDVELPNGDELKRLLVEANLRQRGVRDLAKEGERRRRAAAEAYADGRTTRQRRKANPG